MILDSRGKEISSEQKSVVGCENGFYGVGELGGVYQLGDLSDGWQRNLERLDVSGPCAAHFAAINVCGQAVATLEIEHVRRLPGGGHETILDSQIAKLLKSPNSYQTRSDFMLNLVFSLLGYGNAYALALRDKKDNISSLHLVPPNSTVPHVDYETGDIFYAIGNNPLIPNEIDMLVPARDVLHVKMHAIQHPLVGISPIKHASMSVSVNKSISRNQMAFFNNMSRPSGVLSTDLPLNEDQMSKLRASWNARSKKMDAGDVPILGYGMKWNPMTLTSEDAQLIEAYRMTIEDIARVFRVPLALIGDYTKATYSNTEQLISSWLSTGLGFLLEHIESSLEKFLRLDNSHYIQFNVDRLLRTDFAGRIEGLTKAVQGGLYSPNEARAKEGLSPVEYGEEPRLQSQVIPLSQVELTPSMPAAPAAPVNPPEEESKTLDLIQQLNDAMMNQMAEMSKSVESKLEKMEKKEEPEEPSVLPELVKQMEEAVTKQMSAFSDSIMKIDGRINEMEERASENATTIVDAVTKEKPVEEPSVVEISSYLKQVAS